MIDSIPYELGQAEASGDAPELWEEDEARGRSQGRLTSSELTVFIVGDYRCRRLNSPAWRRVCERKVRGNGEGVEGDLYARRGDKMGRE
jgi:hypothetical protein